MWARLISVRTSDVSQDLQLSQKTLRRLLSSLDVGRSLLLVKDSLEILGLELRGFEDWNSIPEELFHCRQSDRNV